ncbi:collagen alpha-3(IV) chain-like [Dendronephthya gigantea]|uniref:collagen alpha-3(IV) chain-like n=1 Tax=Dendronephthya gigantea TaxID=151771 RepID=UPI00106BBAE3|nr:collagen alpha-3(IV) chain-like [Dendronephthya gigantea]
MAGPKTLLTILVIVCHVHASCSLAESAVEAGQNDKNDHPTNGGCARGLPGRDGRDGRDSIAPGPPGRPGSPGSRGAPGAPGNSGGTVYTRWGKKTCPNGATLIYSGVMGGSHYTHGGGGSNYLCMPLDPIYEKVKAGNQGYSYLYGVEYEMNLHGPLFPNNLHDHEATCAVCEAENRGSQLMIPARNVCPSGWTLEYKGYLMSDHISHKRTEFICVDSNPDAVQGTQSNLNGGLLYVVESHCGSLPCLPYVQGNELTCAVCTK